MSTLSPKRPAVLAGIALAILILLFLVLGGDLLLLHWFGMKQPNAAFFFLDRSLYGVFVLALWAYSVRVERQPLLVWKERKYTLPEYFGAVLLLTVTIFICVMTVNISIYLLTHKKESSEVMKRVIDYFRTHTSLLVYTALTAGVTEELIFRGYLLPRLEMVFKSPYPAIFFSSLLFGLAHFRYGTFINVVDPFVIGLLLAIYYWKYRNIKVAITFHFLWDLIGLLIAIRRH
jgi:membrane protease YdiL (CAAX protease family)